MSLPSTQQLALGRELYKKVMNLECTVYGDVVPSQDNIIYDGVCHVDSKTQSRQVINGTYENIVTTRISFPYPDDGSFFPEMRANYAVVVRDGTQRWVGATNHFVLQSNEMDGAQMKITWTMRTGD